MSFKVTADAYDRFMGRYSRELAPQLADLAGVRAGQRVLDVGCGPGALTAELVASVGAGGVAAVDPSEPFVEAARERFPDVEVQHAPAEELPFPDDSFDAALAQLVVHFLRDPVAGLVEMRRVTRPGGTVAACVWDYAGGGAPLAAFWTAARALDPEAVDESGLPGAREGQLAAFFAAAGLADVVETSIGGRVEHPSFDAWWEPFTLGVGPAGAYVGSLGDDGRAALRERCRSDLGDGGFVLDSFAWAARGTVP